MRLRTQVLMGLGVALAFFGAIFVYAVTRPEPARPSNATPTDWNSNPYRGAYERRLRGGDDAPSASSPEGDHSAELRQRQGICRAAPRCAQGGFCGYEANSFGWIESFDPKVDCVALSPADCEASLRCKVIGWCSWNDLAQDCYIGVHDCAKAKHCTEDGLCTRRNVTGVGADPLGHMCQR